MKKVTSRFIAEDCDGVQYNIIEHTTMTMHTAGSVSHWVKGSKEYSTDSGEPIIMQGEAAFFLVMSGKQLKRV